MAESKLLEKLNQNCTIKVVEEMYLENARRLAMTNMAPTGALVLSLLTGAIKRIAENDDEQGKHDDENDNKKCVAVIPNSFKINCPLPIPLPSERISNYV